MKILGGNQNEHSRDSYFMLYKHNGTLSGWPKEPKLLSYDYGIPRTRLWRSRYSKCRCLPTQQHGFPNSSKDVLRWDAAFGSEVDQALPVPIAIPWQSLWSSRWGSGSLGYPQWSGLWSCTVSCAAVGRESVTLDRKEGWGEEGSRNKCRDVPKS